MADEDSPRIAGHAPAAGDGGAERHQLLVASNRGPVTYHLDEEGVVHASRGGGGLVTALGGLAAHHDLTWVAHAMGEPDVRVAGDRGGAAFTETTRDGAELQLRLVGEPDEAYERFYNELANPLLWFIQHRLYGFASDPVIDRSTYAAWDAYQTVNLRFGDALVQEVERVAEGREEGYAPVVMVHDYQLFLTPGIVRDRTDCFLHFFLHIPWPDPGAWRALPRRWVRAICEGLLACDIVGFQTERDAENFLRTVELIVGADTDFRRRVVNYMGRTCRVRHYPISVDVAGFREVAASAEVAAKRARIREMRPRGLDGTGEPGRLVVRVDRTDPSKNIVRGLRAYQLLLREHEELRGEVSMFMQLDPSRQDISEYREYLSSILAIADEVNLELGTDHWTPLHINLDSDFLAGVGGYCEYDVLFVNPVADGMNLVSKEGPLVNEREGAVVLSEQAGSYNELGPYVVGCNPFDIADQADALARALELDHDERHARAACMRGHVDDYDVVRWIDAQVEDILALREGRPLAMQ